MFEAAAERQMAASDDDEAGSVEKVDEGRNEAASGASEVHTDNDDVLEQLQQLKTEAAIQKQVSKKNAAMKTHEIETAGQRLMQAAEKRDDKPQKCRRLSTLLQNEREEAVERRKLEEQKINLHQKELQLRREELDHQRRQHELIREQMQHQAAQTESLLKL
ncbi:hypothetical protein F441_14827, partial [Phytophthora nicotianae CJ01A1]